MDPKFMRRAIELSIQNVRSGKGGPFGAVVVKDGIVIGEGANQVLTTNDPSAHAEVIAVREACRKLSAFQLAGCEIYSSCEPCPMCLAAIYWARLGALYYGSSQQDAAKAGFDDAFLYEEFRKDSESRSIPAVQLLRDEAWEAFATWIAMPAKVDY